MRLERAHDRPGLPGGAAARAGRPRPLPDLRARRRRRSGRRSRRRPRSSAFTLTLFIAAIAVPLNTVLGILTALVLVRGRFRGKALLDALDRPAVRDLPGRRRAVARAALRPRAAGSTCPSERGSSASPGGMILATIFVSLPFVVREVAPVLREVGDEQEQAAATLGASRWQTFWRITLPAMRWGIAYGVVLSTARAIGEFGAVSVVSCQGGRRDEDAHAARREALPELRPGRRLRGVGAAGRHRPGDAAGHDRLRPRKEDAHDRRRPVREVLRGLHGPGRRVAARSSRGSLTALLGPRARASRRCCASSPGSSSPTRAGSSSTARTSPAVPAAAPRDRLRLPALRRLQAHDACATTSRSA